MTLRIAVLGLGIMGSGMARELVNKGFEVRVWNRNAAKAAPLVAAGARAGATPADAVRDVDLTLAMLADDDASRAVWLGTGGALDAMKPGAVAMESSTLTVEWVRELAREAGNRGVEFLDAPVTGTKMHAESGTLSFLVGGAAETLERVRPALAAMSGSIAHVGPSGSGAMVKLINNFMCGVQVASLAEALGMAERSGLDVRQVAAMLGAGAPGSPLVRMIGQRMIDRAYEPNFFVPLMAKDLAYAQREFARAGIDLKSAEVARAPFLAAAKAGFAERDIASIVELLRRAPRPNA
jgi:3-hydroxyisobutyrate dehydrogenase